MGRVEESAVVRLDHSDAGPHDPGEFVDGDPRRERVRCEGRAEVVHPRGLRDPRRLDSGAPLASAEVVDVERPTLRTGEDVGRIQTGDERVERPECLDRQRHLAE
jgi:hypothetical protein